MSDSILQYAMDTCTFNNSIMYIYIGVDPGNFAGSGDQGINNFRCCTDFRFVVGNS